MESATKRRLSVTRHIEGGSWNPTPVAELSKTGTNIDVLFQLFRDMGGGISPDEVRNCKFTHYIDVKFEDRTMSARITLNESRAELEFTSWNMAGAVSHEGYSVVFSGPTVYDREKVEKYSKGWRQRTGLLMEVPNQGLRDVISDREVVLASLPVIQRFFELQKYWSIE